MTAGRQAGRTALITGAARGQGRAHAVRLAEEGANIIAIDICRDIASVPYRLATPADLAETVRLAETAGARIVALPSDTRDREGLAAAIDAGVAEFGRLDLVVANAGIFCGAGDVGTTAAAWQDTIDVNLTGTYNTLEAAVPHIRAGGRGGSIVITSSAGGVKATALDMDATLRGYFSYTASKTGLLGLMRSFALALAKERIRVNSIQPTGVDTPMIQGEVVRNYFETTAGKAINQNAIPVPSIEPDDVADAVAWLLSDEARYVTGVALPVDAGMMLI